MAESLFACKFLFLDMSYPKSYKYKSTCISLVLKVSLLYIQKFDIF